MRLLFLNFFNGHSRIRDSRRRQAFPCMGGFLSTVGGSLTKRWFCPYPAGPGNPMAPGNSPSPAGNSCRWQTASLKQSWGFLWTKGFGLHPVCLFHTEWHVNYLSLQVVCVSALAFANKELLWEFLNDLTNVCPYLLVCLPTNTNAALINSLEVLS